MGIRHVISYSDGFSLIELVLAVAVLGVCAAIGCVALDGAMSSREARGAAQSCQAAAAWAQIGVLWQGGGARLSYASGSISVVHDYGLAGGSLGRLAAEAPVTANPARWRDGDGAVLAFGGNLASPDGGGSVYFRGRGDVYRLTVRPVSGLTVRSGPEATP